MTDTTPTLADMGAICDELSLPVTHLHWYPNTAPPMPYVVLVPKRTRNRHADNRVADRRTPYDAELYSVERDVPLELRLEAALDAAGIGWERDHATDPDGPAVIAIYSMTLREQEAANG